MAFLWDLLARGLSAHPAAPAQARPAAEAPALPVGRATDGLVGLEKIAFAAREAIATKGSDLGADGRLTLAVLDEAARLIPEGVAIDEAAHVAAVLIPYLVDLRRENVMNNPVVDAQTAHTTPNWR